MGAVLDICGSSRKPDSHGHAHHEAYPHYDHQYGIDVDHRPERSPVPDPELLRMRKHKKEGPQRKYIPNEEKFLFHQALSEQREHIRDKGKHVQPRTYADAAPAEVTVTPIPVQVARADVGGPSVVKKRRDWEDEHHQKSAPSSRR